MNNHTIQLREQRDLRVLDRGHDWWSVLLPGWGQAWVPASEAVKHTVLQANNYPGRNIELELELWNFGIERKPAVLKLLRLLGSSISTLRLINDHGCSLDTWCPSIFAACPGLRSFEFNEMGPENFPLVVQPISESKCPDLRQLSVRIDYITADTVQQLISTIQAIESVRTLQTFSLDVWTAAFGESLPDISPLTAALHVLDTNRELELLELNLPLAASQEDITMLNQQFTRRNHCRLPLPWPVKIAFLSAMWGRSAQFTHSRTLGFDQHIAALILDFAGRYPLRQVKVRMPSLPHM